jgi:type I restriction-modification system DNA methylase subunit
MRKDAGVDGDAQRISQLVWMIFLKIFDDKEYELEMIGDNYKSPIPDRLRWRNWAKNEEGITGDELLDFINNDLFKSLKELSVNEFSNGRGVIVKEVFADSYNYMKPGTLLRQVINKMNLLQEAVRGKLVPQDPNDEPAIELLKRIKAEKEKLITEEKNKKPCHPSPKMKFPMNYQRLGSG